MLFNFVARPLIWIIWCSICAYGYQIDKSCVNKQIDTKIDESIKEAFAMAQAGVDALETGFTIWSTPGQFAANVVPARHPKVQRLIENVFAHQDIIDDRVPLPQRNVEYNYKMNMNNLKLYKVYQVLRGILSMQQKTNNAGSRDVVIYCDDAHFDLNDDKSSVVTDKDRDNIYLGSAKAAIYRCSRGETSGTTVAVTWGAPQGDTLNNEKDVEYSAALHLCTGSVENIKKGWFDGYGAFRRRVRGSFNKIMTSSGGVHGFRQVDAFKLLSVTLLHEMTHTRAGQQLDDVKLKSILPTRTTTAYRWDRVKKLAKNLDPLGVAKNYVDRDGTGAPDNNADSIAYFGLGCFMMSKKVDEKKAQEITDDGKVVDLESAITFP